MNKTLILAGLSLALAGSTYAGSTHNRDYDLYVIADEVTDSAIYVVTNSHETVAIEVFDDDTAHWIRDSEARKAIARAEAVFGPVEEAQNKGFEFSVKDDDVRISFPVLFFKHISIHAKEDEWAQIDITSKNGEGDVFVRAGDDGAFITIVDASAKDAREFIDDIDQAPKAMRKKMKTEMGLN